MKQAYGWNWPDHEQHLLEWLAKAPPHKLNGRLAYQGNKQAAALKHCKSFRTAVDVGAHVGLWSFNLAKAFKRVEAFEPVKEHRLCFAANVTDLNVTMHACALGATEGMVAIETSKGSSGDSKIDVRPIAAQTIQTIPLKRLDSFGLADVDFIKVDCEGFEENVLIGAMITVMACKPTIIVEQKREMAARFGLQPQGAVRILEAWGYKVAEELNGDFIMVPK